MQGRAGAARARAQGAGAARPHPYDARALLVELEQVPGIRADSYYASLLPELVRTAVILGERELAVRLVAAVEPHTPLAKRALTACRAELAEAAGE